jgi:VWFA-related protein
MFISTVHRPAAVLLFATVLLGGTVLAQQDEGFVFRTSVDLVSVNATVTDARGHFVPGLRANDFIIREDGELQTITQFEAERVPVSLGIALDTSGSMAGDKMEAARAALERFVYDLLGPSDEMFLYRFDNRPILVQDWTEDRARLARRLGSVTPSGGTALYDAVAEAIPLAATGTRRKKALLVISDGNDSDSGIGLEEVRQVIRQSEAMVYAIGIDSSGAEFGGAPAPRWPLPGGVSIDFPWPGGRPRPRAPSPRTRSGQQVERVNERALRMMTDDSGGRTEIVSGARNLDQATAGIASELSQQYYLGYVSTRPKDGRWHTITVETRRGNYQVRSRRGFVAE